MENFKGKKLASIRNRVVNMKIQELVDRKIKFEQYLLTAVANLTEKFKEDTGVSPNFIHISLTSMVTIGKSMPEYYVDNVTVEIIL